MNTKQIVLSFLLVDFAALTAWALYQEGLSGMIDLTIRLATGGPMGLTFLVDLVLALSLLINVMWQDARSRGINPLPYALLTATTGSVGPLLYLIRREATPATGAEPARPASAW